MGQRKGERTQRDHPALGDRGQQQAMLGKKPGVFYDKEPISSSGPGPPLGTRMNRPTRTPSTACNSASRKGHSSGKALTRGAREQPGSAQQQPLSAPPHQARDFPTGEVLKPPGRSGHGHPSDPCFLLAPHTDTPRTKHCMDITTACVGLFCDGKEPTAFPCMLLGEERTVLRQQQTY